MRNSRPEPKPQAPREPEPRPAAAKVNPVEFAFRWLGRRLEEKPSGYWLDCLPVGLDKMVQAANRAATLGAITALERITEIIRSGVENSRMRS